MNCLALTSSRRHDLRFYACCQAGYRCCYSLCLCLVLLPKAALHNEFLHFSCPFRHVGSLPLCVAACWSFLWAVLPSISLFRGVNVKILQFRAAMATILLLSFPHASCLQNWRGTGFLRLKAVNFRVVGCKTPDSCEAFNVTIISVLLAAGNPPRIPSFIGNDLGRLLVHSQLCDMQTCSCRLWAGASHCSSELHEMLCLDFVRIPEAWLQDWNIWGSYSDQTNEGSAFQELRICRI